MASINDIYNYLKNAYNTIKGFVTNHQKIYFDPTPQVVQVPTIDEDGNLVYVDVKNIAQIKKDMWDAVGGALGQFNKTVYVDAENGDDNNPGTASEPFKTLKKAFDSAPVGSNLTIVLAGSDDYDNPIEYKITSDIIVRNRFITLKANGSNRFAKITAEVFVESGILNHAYGILLFDSTLRLSSNSIEGFIILENPKRTDTNKGWAWHHKGIINFYGGVSSVFLNGWPADYSQIVMTDEGGSNIFNVSSRNAGTAFAAINLWYLNAKVENSNCKIIDFYQGDSHVSGAIDARVKSIIDNNGNNLELKDVISGIVIDSDTGLAKNVLSATL